MLYTFSRSDYPLTELENHLTHAGADDAVLLWQNGVLLAVKYPALFDGCRAPCYALESDLNARNIAVLMTARSAKVRSISMTFLVKLTEIHSPQLAL